MAHKPLLPPSSFPLGIGKQHASPCVYNENLSSKWSSNEPSLVSSPRHLFTWYDSCRPGKRGRRHVLSSPPWTSFASSNIPSDAFTGINTFKFVLVHSIITKHLSLVFEVKCILRVTVMYIKMLAKEGVPCNVELLLTPKIVAS